MHIENILVSKEPEGATPIYPVTESLWKSSSDGLADFVKGLATSQKFKGRPDQLLVVPDIATGWPARVYAGVKSPDDRRIDNMWAFAPAAEKLPKGAYRIMTPDLTMNSDEAYKAAVGWALARYQWDVSATFSTPARGPALVVPRAASARFNEIASEVKATWLARDLINGPANIITTDALARAALAVAHKFNAKAGVIRGNDLLEQEFRLIHAVGRASAQKPNLTYFSWSGPDAGPKAPRVSLVGKGVVFDTGGLDLKTADGMLTMKKDMGGAAITLALASMIMANNLPIHLSVALPMVENSVSSNAFRPSDVIRARNGTQVYIGNTDAEGRLILAEAEDFVSRKFRPHILIDIATLTGAQRTADGYQVGGIFTADKTQGRLIEDIGASWNDPLQLHHLFAEEYAHMLKPSPAAGGAIHSAPGGNPGATLAALFLRHFTDAATHIHCDVNGANVVARPGRPLGGEVQAMRALYRWLENMAPVP